MIKAAFALTALLLAVPITALAAEKPLWCQIDDPAGWAEARKKLIASGEKDLTKLACPALAAPGGTPVELALPLPCGRHMLFRRIDVPARGGLDQVNASFGRVIDIGAETPQSVLSNSPWNAPVAGTFALDEAGEPLGSDGLERTAMLSFYLAKYELTQPQWLAYEMGLFTRPPAETLAEDAPACADFNTAIAASNLRQIEAKGGLSWFDAVDFSRAYSAWMIALDKDRIAAKEPSYLPWNQGATGYLRLPTEAEWEYGARGGAAYVTAQNRGRQLYQVMGDGGQPRDASLDEICAPPPRSDVPRPGAVGTRLPNMLGLYDMLCNAEEIVLDFFRPTRPDGLAGQVGGVISKGGSSLVLREGNAIGRRSEVAALFTQGGEGRTPALGMRLAISAPVFAGRRDEAAPPVEGLANPELEKDMLASRQTLLQGGANLASADPQAMGAELAGLREQIAARELSREELERKTDELQVQMDRMNVALAEKEKEAVRFSIRSGLLTGNLIDRIGRNIGLALFELARLEDVAAGTKLTNAERRSQRARILSRIAENEARIQDAYDLYLQVQVELAARPAPLVDTAIRDTRASFADEGGASLAPNLDLLIRHLETLREGRGQISDQMRADWISDLDATRAERRNDYPDFQ
ncbi:formylglycine-generating enzyme family protein [Paracoccus aminophilus]|uniref:Sulfatase-modifying factor enzyme-like domain-containing protein n=1 Tax=Paracoccus aminophilus JCM 7686 TaxID=1367847 RepID=S5XL40_PARAH|nr:SUMF1/EgtB/PvdO family nonheme iron enzyme [Paracoccus aminophilus]AGT07929.1 hypothetical protein JCM7686_0820 [Paracoccus aminophilus JCM 7686]